MSEVKPSALTQRLEWELIKQMYRLVMPGLASTMALSLVAVITLWEITNKAPLLLWFTLMFMASVYRFVLTMLFTRHHVKIDSIKFWKGFFDAGVGVTAIGWCILATHLFPLQSQSHQIIILVILAGVSAGALPFLSYQYRAYALYSLTILTPLAAWVLIHDVAISGFLAFMIMLFAGVLQITAKRFNRNLSEALYLRFENETLVRHLEQSKKDLESINEHLIQEVDDRERAEADLRETNLFQKRIMESATDVIAVINDKGQVTKTNHVLSDITGYSVGEILEKPASFLFPEKTWLELRRHISDIFTKANTAAKFEADTICKSGKMKILNINLTPLLENDKVIAIVMTADDVTERKQIDRMKSEFISTVSHELRTPLTSVNGAIGLLEANYGEQLDTQARTLMDLAHRNCDRLLHLINDLLDLQKLEEGALPLDMKAVSLDEIVSHCVSSNKIYAVKYAVDLQIEIEKSDMKVKVDRARFEQVMANLLSNAIKFSPENSIVRVRVSELAGNAKISVIDQGVGIKDDFKSKVFSKFAQEDGSDTRKVGGTGLGLSISKRLVEKMNGQIGFMSSYTRGSTFFITFPLLADNTEEFSAVL